MMLAVQAAANCPKHSRKFQKPKPPINAQKCRNQAINVDRFSRVFFPLLFFVLNAIYWITFARYI